MGHRKDNPALRDFGYNDNTIRTTKLFKPIEGNCRNEDPTIASLNVETVPCRPRNKEVPQENVPVGDYKPVKTAIFIATYLQKTYFCLLNEL